MLRKCRLACFGRVQEKEESVPACMLWSGAEKREDRAGAHARERERERERDREREKGTEGECIGMYGVPSILVLINSQA